MEYLIGDFKPYKKNIATLLTKREWLEPVMEPIAATILANAIRESPVSRRPARAGRKKYIESFETRKYIRRTPQSPAPRFVVAVGNTAPGAYQVETGTRNNPAYAPLRKGLGRTVTSKWGVR